MKPKLSPQCKKVYAYIRDNHGCTSHDITRDTFVQKPCARITELRKAGIDILEVGTVRYPGTKAFVKYAIGKPMMKREQVVQITDGVAHVSYKEVPV